MADSIRRTFDNQLSDLRSRLYIMSGVVREEFDLGFQALADRDPDAVEAVYAIDEEMRDKRSEIERGCFTLLSRQQPVAHDLRRIIVYYNVALDLERMGQQAKGLARSSRRVMDKPPCPLPHGLALMHDKARQMHDATFSAWEQGDLEQIDRVIAADDEVDELDRTVKEELFRHMAETSDEDLIATLYEYIRATREVERFADLVCMVARDVQEYTRMISFSQ